MPIFDAGLFVILNGLAIFFTFIGMKTYGFIHIIAIVIFMAMAIVIFAGYDVAYQVDTTDGTTWFNTTKYVIGSGSETEALGSQWLGFVYFLVGILNIYLFIKETPFGTK